MLVPRTSVSKEIDNLYYISTLERFGLLINRKYAEKKGVEGVGGSSRIKRSLPVYKNGLAQLANLMRVWGAVWPARTPGTVVVSKVIRPLSWSERRTS